MKNTNTMQFCFAKNNEAKFIELALKLKLKKLCFVYDSADKIKKDFLVDGVRIYTALLYKGKKIDKSRKNIDFIIAEHSDNTRSIIEHRHADIIYGLETNKEGDFIHFRNSGMNQVIAKLCKEKKVNIAFNFSLLLKSNPRKKAVVFGRMMQNMMLCKKYKIDYLIAGFVKNEFELRNEKALKAFGSLL